MSKTLSQEIRIQWLDRDLPLWVREKTVDLMGRDGLSEADCKNIEKVEGKVLGYSELNNEAAPASVEFGVEYFWRRVFVLRESDFEGYSEGACPVEAVEPLSIKPGVKGVSPKKKLQVGVRLPKELMWQLNAYSQLANLSQTDVILRALTDYLSKTYQQQPLELRVKQLEQRMSQMEKQLSVGSI